MLTAVVQIFIVYISGCVALLAYTIHNFGDAAHPFVDCFSLIKRKSTKEYTYGYGKVEDLAGVVIVLPIMFARSVWTKSFIFQELQYMWVLLTNPGRHIIVVFDMSYCTSPLPVFSSFFTLPYKIDALFLLHIH